MLAEQVIEEILITKLIDRFQKRGLFADWMNDGLRLYVIEAYFAAMDENYTTNISNDTQHGRLMQLQLHRKNNNYPFGSGRRLLDL